MASVSGHWASRITDAQYLASQIEKYGIEAVCSELHDQGEGQLANEVMIAYTRMVQEEQAERVKALKKYFDNLLDWCCDLCEGKEKCEKHATAIRQRKEGLSPLAIGTLLSCPFVKERVSNG